MIPCIPNLGTVQLIEGFADAARLDTRTADYLSTVTSNAPASVIPVLWNAARIAASS